LPQRPKRHVGSRLPVTRDPLYPLAAGVIPTLLAFSFQLNLHRQAYPGNRLLAAVTIIAGALGWLTATVTLLDGATPPLVVRRLIVASVALPALFLFYKMLFLVWKWPAPPLGDGRR
jgi:hypothetical protein